MADERIDRYFRLRYSLADYFYSLRPAQRWHIVQRESFLLLFYLFGGIFAQGLNRGFSWIGQAHAQTATEPVFIGLNKHEWGLALSVVLNLVLVAILMLCVIQLVFGKKQNAWAAKTATFLLGFLTKSLMTLTTSI
jgi:hypothetical protein